MTDLSNTDLELYFHNYHRAIKDETLRALGERVLTVKQLLGDKELLILMEPSFTMFDVKISVIYAYGREIYPLEQQELIYNGVCLRDEQIVMETMVYDSGIIFMNDSGLVKIEDDEQETIEVKSEQDFCVIQEEENVVTIKEEGEIMKKLVLSPLPNNGRNPKSKTLSRQPKPNFFSSVVSQP